MGTEMLRGVYPERSEGLSMTAPILVVKIHHRARVGKVACLHIWDRTRAINVASTPRMRLLDEERRRTDLPPFGSALQKTYICESRQGSPIGESQQRYPHIHRAYILLDSLPIE